MKILDYSELIKSRYTTYCRKYFLDRENRKKEYTFIKRNKEQKAVIVIGKIPEHDLFVLIKQFRIPFEDYFIEFPAGLVDRGESLEQAALRELKEETGYQGEIVSISPAISTSPGLTTEMVHFIFIEIKGKEQQNTEPSEDIEVMLVSRKDWEMIKSGKTCIQSWTYLFMETYFNAGNFFAFQNK